MPGMAVVMTAWRRPEYLSRALHSWMDARGIVRLGQGGKLRVHIDHSSQHMHRRMEEVVRRNGWGFEVNLFNYGVLVNPVESVSSMFRARPDVDFVILAEEDVVVSADVLEYFAWAQRFRADQSVGAVCAHRPQRTTVAQPRPEAVLRVPGFACPLVWGTWRDRWEGWIEPTWDRDYRADGWDWNLKRVMLASGRASLCPEQNRSDHIGEHGGVHCTAALFPETVDPFFRAGIPACDYRLAEGPE